MSDLSIPLTCAAIGDGASEMAKITASANR